MTATIDGVDTTDMNGDRAPEGKSSQSPANESRRNRRQTPPGAEQMARPWRLGVLGVGISVGLISRLLAANGVSNSLGDAMLYAGALTSLLAGLGVLAQSAERDRFGRWMILLTAMTGLSLGALQWISPNFPSGTLEWSDSTQLALAALGLGNGVLFSGILTLALVRRWPTITVVAVLCSAVLTLTANTVLLRREWPAIVVLALAFLFVLVGWDRAPRHEPTYRAQEGSPRISRAALSLATVALSGAGIQLWISRGEDIGRAIPAVGVSVVLLVLAFMAMIRIRRELQQRETTLSEWTSWMREFRTGDLRTDFESLGTTESGTPVGDLTAEPPRTLSFPDLRLVEDKETAQPVVESAAPPALESVTATSESPAGDDEVTAEPATQPTLFGDEPPAALELQWFDPEPLDHDLAPRVATVAPDQPSLFDFERDLFADDGDSPTAPASSGEVPPVLIPSSKAPQIIIPTSDTPFVQADAPHLSVDSEPDRAAPVAAVDDDIVVIALTPPSRTSEPSQPPTPAAPIIETPTTPAASVAPANAPSAFSTHAAPSPQPSVAATAAAATSAAHSGAFSTWVGHETSAARSTPDMLAAWLGEPAAADTHRLIAAIETMSLADFDLLPAHVTQAMNDALLDMVEQLTPEPTQVTAIDGPYLMVAWEHIERSGLGAINTQIRELLSVPVDTDEGPVALSGTLALLQPGNDATFDQVLDDAIIGLVQARQLEVAAKAR